MFDLDAFILAPSQELLLSITRDDLVRVAGHYKLEVSGGPSKADLQEMLVKRLRELGEFGKVVPDIPTSPDQGKRLPIDPSPSKAALELKRLQLREKEIEWEREKNKLEADRRLVREREQREHEFRLKDLELAQALRIKELEVKAREAGVAFKPDQFEITRNIRLVPPFNESEVDKFFAHFERVATTFKWPKEIWTMTLQCVFTGKAQEAYSSLTLEDAADYEKVKHAVLRIYALVPEAYRQKFRSYLKPEALTFVEYVREKEMLFDRWLSSQEVTTFQSLRDLIILEDFKNGLPQTVATHVSEHKNLTPARAAVLADEYVLTHKRVLPNLKLSQNVSGHSNASKMSKEIVPVPAHSPDHRPSRSSGIVPTCAYCKKRGHVLSECYTLKRKNKTASQPASYRSEVGLCVSNLPVSSNDPISDKHGFAPFIMDGFVSLPGEHLKTPVKILRDTGASQSFILRDALPFCDETFTGDSILVRGFEMGHVSVPLHEISLMTDLVTGNVIVGVRPSLPIENVSMLLGNDLCGGKVLPCPIVSPDLPKTCTDDLSISFPEVFSSSVVTRAMARKELEQETEEQFDLSDTFIARPSPHSDSELRLNSDSLSFSSEVPKFSMSREELIKEQESDPSLSSFFSEVLSEEDIEHTPHGYFLRDGVLMRKWRPLMASAQDEWRVLFQVVVPVAFRDKVLSLAHDHHFLAGY